MAAAAPAQGQVRELEACWHSAGWPASRPFGQSKAHVSQQVGQQLCGFASAVRVAAAVFSRLESTAKRGNAILWRRRRLPQLTRSNYTWQAALAPRALQLAVALRSPASLKRPAGR